MRATITAAVALAIGHAGGVLAQTPAPAPASPPILDCAGTFTKRTDEAALVKQFGRENVVAADLAGAEGRTERGLVIYPRDPARRLEVFWSDAKPRRIATVRVRGKSTWVVRTSGRAGRTLGLRASLEDVETINGKPFTLYGFFWDMGGLTTGWKGGKLDALEGGCSASARFDPDPEVKGRAVDAASGEKEFGSSDRAVRAVRPFVSTIDLDWGE